MKYWILFLMLPILFASPTFAKQSKELPAVTTIVNFTNLNGETIQSIIKGEHPEVAVECKRGTSLPLKLFYNFNILSVSLNPNVSIKVDNPFYIRCTGKKAFISEDLTTWVKAGKYFEGHPVYDIKIDKKGLQLDGKLVPYPEISGHVWDEIEE